MGTSKPDWLVGCVCDNWVVANSFVCYLVLPIGIAITTIGKRTPIIGV